jgi:hypothetical protein
VPASTPASTVLANRRLDGYLQDWVFVVTNVIEGQKKVVLAGENDLCALSAETPNSTNRLW